MSPLSRPSFWVLSVSLVWIPGHSNIPGNCTANELTRAGVPLPESIHTYIHIWPLQPFSQDYNLASHRTYIVCVNFIHEWQGLQFKVDSERQMFLRNYSWQIYLISDFLPEICSCRSNICCISFWRGSNSNKPMHKPTAYLLQRNKIT